MTDSYISDEMRAAVGTELSRRVSYPIDLSAIRRWAIAVHHPDDPPARYWDETAAPGAMTTPRDFNPFAWMVAEPAGELTGNRPGETIGWEESIGIAAPATRFQLNGGARYDYGEPMRAGDVITSCAVLHGYDEREGRLGRMLFTQLRDTWTNQRGDLVGTTTLTLIRY